MPITAIVTGATGFLGRRLVRSLLQEPEVQVRCLVRESSDTGSLLKELNPSEQERIHILRGSLTDEKFVAEHFANSDVVYHLAATLTGTPSTMHENTVVPTRKLMECAARADVERFVLVSSIGVYGTQSIDSWGTLDETTPVDPHPERRDPYTFSKFSQELVATELSEQLGLPIVIVRPGVIYGPGRSALTSRVGLLLGPLVVRMGGIQLLPYTHVENCAEGIKLAGLTTGIDGEVFNLVDDDLPTGQSILRLMKQHGKKSRTIWIPHGAIGPIAGLCEWCSNLTKGRIPPVLTRYKSSAIWKPLRYSNAKAKNKLNWQPKISIEEGLQRTIAG